MSAVDDRSNSLQLPHRVLTRILNPEMLRLARQSHDPSTRLVFRHRDRGWEHSDSTLWPLDLLGAFPRLGKVERDDVD